MRLRFAADRRVLFWALVLFPLVPALGYARPALVPWLVPFSIYLSFCAGVLTHYHNHCPVFVGRRANLAYGAWLSFFYGFPSFAWIPTHNQNHHRYVNGEGDATRTSRYAERDSLFAALTYPIASSRYQLDAVAAYVREAFLRNPARRRRIVLEVSALIGGHVALFGLAVALHGAWLGAGVYAATVGIPAALGSYWMMLVNYLQHVDCDPSSPDDHSRNFVSPAMNWLVFESGLHTVHHEHPGMHWSTYRALHQKRASRIDPRLNAGTTFGYVFAQYGAAPLRRLLSVRRRAAGVRG